MRGKRRECGMGVSRLACIAVHILHFGLSKVSRLFSSHKMHCLCREKRRGYVTITPLLNVLKLLVADFEDSINNLSTRL